MASRCRTERQEIVHEYTEVVSGWRESHEERCRDVACNWWTLCLNKVFCWVEAVLIWFSEEVVRRVIEVVYTVVCEGVSAILDVAAMLVSLVYAIPILGAILRTIVEWAGEIINRAASLIDFFLSLGGVQLRKRMYVGLIVTVHDGVPVDRRADVDDRLTNAMALAASILKRECNIDVVFTGRCTFRNTPPDAIANFRCDGAGFFAEWIHNGFFETAILTCRTRDNWRRILGHGAEIVGLVVKGGHKLGCSFGSRAFFYLNASSFAPSTIAHEIGHNCLLADRTGQGDQTNLMFGNKNREDHAGGAENLTLTTWQRSVIRSSRFCSYT